MASLNGLFGTFSGKIGNCVGCRWKGGMYIRTKPRPNPNYKPSPAQLAQRQKFKLATDFTRAFAPLFKISFRQPEDSGTGKSKATSYILKHAIAGTAPDFHIVYSQVRISQGDLPGANEVTARADAMGGIHFTWRNIGVQGRASSRDKALVAVYCPELNQSVYHTAAADRSAEAVTINTVAFAGKAVHTWLGFISEDGELIANSVYTGEFVVS